MPTQALPAQRHERALCTGTQNQRYRTCITQVLRDWRDNGTKPQDKRRDIHGPRWYRRPFSVCNLSKLVYHSRTCLLLFNMNHPRLCRTLLAERHYAPMRFSGRTPDNSGVGFPILARLGELYTWYSKLYFCQSARPLGRAEFPRPLRKGHA